MTAADPAHESIPDAYRFGDFELRPGTRELLRAGESVELQPKVFDFIAYLLVHRDRAVSKDELLDTVWPGQVVTESALTRCVRRARQALGDSAEQPWAILTLHARGYRFIAPVVTTSLAAEDMTSAGREETGRPRTDVPTVSQPRKWRFWRWGAAALLLAVASIAWWPGRQAEPIVPADGLVHLAVLPLDNLTGETRKDWARLGLMNSISEILRREGKVRVLNPREVMGAVNRFPADELANRLRDSYGVTHVVQGRIEGSGAQLRLFYTLGDSAGKRRERTVTGPDIPALAHAAGADLRVLLGRSRHWNVQRDAFANEAHLRGLALKLQGDIQGALPHFRMAAEQAPEAFWPRYEIAAAMRDLGRLAEAVTALEALREEALRSGDAEHLRETSSALGVTYQRIGNLPLAIERLESALVYAEKAGDLERTVSVLNNLGVAYMYSGQYTKARTTLIRAVHTEASAGIERGSGALMNNLGHVNFREGFLDAAEAHIQRAIEQFRLIGEQRNEAIVTNGLGEVRCAQGRFAEAYALAEQALPVSRKLGNRVSEADAHFVLACADAGLGRLSRAIEHAQTGLALAEAASNQQNVGYAHNALGQYYRARGEFALARQSTLAAIETNQRAGDTTQAREDRLQLARLALAEGGLEEAESLARAVEEEALAAEQHLIATEARHTLAQVRLAAGDAGGASRWIDQAQAAAKQMVHPRLSAEVELTRAEIALAQGDIQTAAMAVASAESLLEVSPRRQVLAAELAAARGDPAQALALESAAKEAAGEAWLASDETRLKARQRAARG